MNTLHKVLLAGLTGLAMAPCMAGGVIPTCYEHKLQAPNLLPAKEVFVIVDQTTLLDATLQQAVANQVSPLLKPGNGFSVLVFSAFTQGKYTQLLTSGQLDHPLPNQLRDDISKTVLGKFDQCLSHQPTVAAQHVGGALRTAFGGTSDGIANSDILASLKDIAGKVKQSAASEKVVLLVSDMLENSSVTSFYANQSVRKIDAAHELQTVVNQQLLADFGGARVYVMGAGLLNQTDSKSRAQYRDPKTMQALASFWRAYFEKSHAQLVDFGMPALLNPIN